MSDIQMQKKKTVVLAGALACFQMPGLLITQHLHSSRYLPAFVVCWCLFMMAIFILILIQLAKLLKMKRSVNQ